MNRRLVVRRRHQNALVRRDAHAEHRRRIQIGHEDQHVELVLIALCGCTGYDVVAILKKKREPLTSLEVRAKAERATSPPQVFTEIRLIYQIGGKVSHKAAEDAVRLSEEKYCSVSAMLRKTAKITTQIEYVDE